MDLSNVLLLVTTPEIPAVRDTKRIVDILHGRHGYTGKLQVVVNRYPSKSAISLQQIERSLDLKPVATVPSDGNLITNAINEGVSILGGPSDLANNFAQLAVLLAQPRRAKAGRPKRTAPMQSKKRSLLRRRHAENRGNTEHRIPSTERA
jgi:Flp pilus assembly CpaE family ATPase